MNNLYRHVRIGLALALAVAPLLGSAQALSDAPAAHAQPASGLPEAAGAAASVPALQTRMWARVPRVHGRITAKQLGLVINTNDPYSVAVGRHYAKVRQIPARQILRVALPVRNGLSAAEFADFNDKLQAFFGPQVQGLALAWRQPYAVECNAITAAVTMGLDRQLCEDTGGASRRSTYFGTASSRPYTDHGMRLSMLLAASTVDKARELIDRGARSDHTLGRRGALPVHAHFLITSDAFRNARQGLFPPPTLIAGGGVQTHLDRTDALRDARRVILYQTGAERVEGLDSVDFVPGALADHLTSYGGALSDSNTQMTVLSWIDAGATASYGTTSEPRSYPQKFPHPQALLLFYMQGATALEAYWKSVMWPQQGLFVGDPLAAPFAQRP